MTYHERVLAYEAQGMTTSDAQGIAGVDLLKAANHWKGDTMTQHTKVEFTKGPWKAEGWMNTIVNAADSSTIVGMPGGGQRARIEEIQANARLIAAAPDLLAALKLALTTIERLTVQHGAFNSTQGTQDVIQQALAKAEGASHADL